MSSYSTNGFDQGYKYATLLRDVAIQSFEGVGKVWEEVQETGVSFTMSALYVFDEHVISLLQHNLLQVVCYVVLLFLVIALQRENQSYSRLVQDLKVTKSIMKHCAWQVHEADSEMQALTSRLKKNELTRIPAITRQLENIYTILDKRKDNVGIIERELNFMTPEVESQVAKLKKLNEKLRVEFDDDRIFEIRGTGIIAANRINAMQDKLHDRIEKAKKVLDLTNDLMNIKGIPMRVEW